jgi:RNA polymerase sigma factor (sigma-70 family)
VGTVTLPAGAQRAGRPLRSKRLLALAGDERLVSHLRRGNEAAFEVIFERHSGGILAFCRHMLGSREEAEDAVQHTFAAAYRDLVQDEREIRLKAWLYTIARNRCLSVLRGRRDAPSEWAEVATAGLQEEVERRVELRELLADLQELPEEQRAALVLSELGDLSHADVAGVLRVEVPKVKALVFRARSGLMERRQARETPCIEIREQLSVLRGGALRRSELRHHLRHCQGCREYREEVRRQRAMMAAVLPVTPTVALKSNVLSALGLGGSAAGAAVSAPVGGAALAKLAVVAVVAGGGAVAGEQALEAGTSERPVKPLVAPAASHRHGGQTPAEDRAASHRPIVEPTKRRSAANTNQGVRRRVRAHGKDAAPGRPASPGERGLGLERRSPKAQSTPRHGAPAREPKATIREPKAATPPTNQDKVGSPPAVDLGTRARGGPPLELPQEPPLPPTPKANAG